MVAVVVSRFSLLCRSLNPFTLLNRLREDERGVVLVQALLILPILILAVFGGYTVWKVISIKQSLHSGTYQATRYLCLYPVDPPGSGGWQQVAQHIVQREVQNNPLADGASLPWVTVFVSGDELLCDPPNSFVVQTEMYLEIGIPYLPFMTLTLQDRHEGWVQCR